MAYQAELSEEFEETSDVQAKNRKTRVIAPKKRSDHDVEQLINPRKNLASGTCQIKTIILGRNVRGTINK